MFRNVLDGQYFMTWSMFIVNYRVYRTVIYIYKFIHLFHKTFSYKPMLIYDIRIKLTINI